MADEVVTYDDVSRWLPADIRDELIRAMPYEIRGWLTEEEAANYDGRLVEVRYMEDRESRYLPC